MEQKPIRFCLWSTRGTAQRNRTYFRLPVDAACALLSRLSGADPVDVAQRMRAPGKLTETWERDGVAWVLTAARVVEGNR
ncbi:MAG TPA: hypothetical protein VEK85_17115 [Gemmatimonadales bacterium]|nr:hypothetical protein [Gemmatimonadales bacterium]